MENNMKFAEYVAKRLREIGCSEIFGVPGSYIMPIWQNISINGELTLACHENGAGFMADGWARGKRKIGAVLTTSGPGLTNAITSIVNAYMDSIPLIIISGQISNECKGRGAFQECFELNRSFNQGSLIKSVTKAHFEITNIENAQYLFETAIYLAKNGRPGPVHITIPVDIQEQTIEIDSIREIRNSRRYNNFSKEIVDEINASKKPLILVGWGSYIAKVEAEIELLANKIKAPIITSLKGLAAIKYDNAFFIGHLGAGSNRNIINFIEKYDSDLIIILGASLASHYYKEIGEYFLNKQIIQIDIDGENVGYRNSLDFKMIDDLKNCLPILIENILEKNNENIKVINDYKEVCSKKEELILKEERKTLSMISSIDLINKYSNENTVYFPDSGNGWLNSLSLLKLKNYGSIHLSVGLATMGYSYGAAIGYAIANPSKKVVVIGGDGSFLMSGNESLIAKYKNLNIVIIIFNNNCLGRVRIGQGQNYQTFKSSAINGVDYSKIGNGLGIESYKVTNIVECKNKLEKIFNSEKASILEIIVDEDEIPLCLR
ncbi:thiamine pyrophosphate-binding protein [Cetobacterium sp.]|uniref:thiamine pyrophosphate-binding protein n=1 Tax=Cetobacterium sp. TaxID=2071632 RepID=UPI003F3F14C9